MEMTHTNIIHHEVAEIKMEPVKTSYMNDGTPVITRRIILRDQDGGMLELVLFADTEKALEIKEEK